MTTTPTVTNPTPKCVLWELGNNEEGDPVFVERASLILATVSGTNGVQNGNPQGITVQWSSNDSGPWYDMSTLGVSMSNLLNGTATVIGPTLPSEMYVRAISGLGVSVATDLDISILVW